MAEDLTVKVNIIKKINGIKISNLITEAHGTIIVNMKDEKHRSWTNMVQTQLNSPGEKQ